MAATYRGPTTGGQPGPLAGAASGVGGDDVRGSAARRVADELLLASCRASDREAALRVEKRVREAALRFVLAGPSRSSAAVRACLDELVGELADDRAGAFVLVGDRKTGDWREWSRSGTSAGAGLLAPPAAALLACAGEGAALEIPDGDRRRAAVEGVALAAGVASLRWSLRRSGADGLVLVALHSPVAGRCWTPSLRRLHDGLAEVFAVAAASS
jgi:hypothetical protein